MISNVTMNGRGDGITLQDCSSVTIADCHLLDNAIGIEIANSSNTTILRNEIANHPTRAINLGKGKDNIIANNVFINNSYAIAPFQDEHCNGNMIISNTFRRNDFSITANSKMTISGNSFEDNNHAIMLSGSGSAGTTVTQNSFSNNRNALYISGSSGNSIYLNNFFENEHQVTDAGVKSSSVKTTKRELNSETLLQPQAPHFNSLNFIQPPPPSTNQYDNGAKGNYWIDYDGSDKNKDGIGDTAYLLYENNQDNHPLISPYTVPPSFTIPSAPPTIDPEQNQEELASFPLTLTIAALALTIIGFALGLLYYRKKQRHQAV
jgi:parallel beta-helix repeat protein